MNVNIKPKDCQFYVNEVNRKVVCVIPNTADLFFDYIRDFQIEFEANSKFWHRLVMPHHFTGIATCNPADSFSEETGRLIAFHKAKRKLNTSFFKRAQTFVNKMDEEYTKVVESFNDFGERLSETSDHREKRINEMLGAAEK